MSHSHTTPDAPAPWRRLLHLRTVVILLVGLAGGFHLGRASAPEVKEPHPHEYAPLRPLHGPQAARALEVARDQFSGPTLQGDTVGLERLLEENRLVMVTWFAEWCANCGYEAPFVGELARRYADRGLAVVARSEYSHPDEVRRFLGAHALLVPVVEGSPNPDPEVEDEVRLHTTHYRFRSALGDTRKWGTPMTLLFADGGATVWVVLGEFVPDEMEALIESRLDA